MRPWTSILALVMLLPVGGGGMSLHEPDRIEAGRAVVVGGEDGAVTPCFLCHGLDGVGDGTGAFPRLAGQAAFYLYKQMVDYASGARPNPIMTPIARQLSIDQMEDVAVYYASRKAPYHPPPEVEPALLERARQITEDGLPEAGVEACVFCHGEAGLGLAPSFPYLAGQYAPYTALQLRLWKEGARHNDPVGVMKQIADQLSDTDVRALALYFETVRP